MIEGPEEVTRGGEWEPIKIPRGYLPYVPKSTQRTSLLTQFKTTVIFKLLVLGTELATESHWKHYSLQARVIS
jgi:hypothetical protein